MRVSFGWFNRFVHCFIRVGMSFLHPLSCVMLQYSCFNKFVTDICSMPGDNLTIVLLWQGG